MYNKIRIVSATIGILIAIMIISICVGSYPLSVNQIWDILQGKLQETMEANVFWNLRFPRVLMGVVSGGALGLAGGVYQTIFRNSLASPDLTGVASGASFGAACTIVLGAGSAFSIMAGAFVMGMLSLVFVLLLTRISNMEKVGSYILAGIIVSSLADAGIMMFKFMANPEKELAAIEFWTMGSLSTITNQKIVPQIWFVIAPMILLLLLHRQIVILSLGSEHARSLGISPEVWRIIFLSLSTLMVAAVVSVTGVIAFVGLIAPHITFIAYKRRNATYFFLCAMWGGIILLIADIFARSLYKGAELPLSILTVLLSVPILIWLLCRKRGRNCGSNI